MSSSSFYVLSAFLTLVTFLILPSVSSAGQDKNETVSDIVSSASSGAEKTRAIIETYGFSTIEKEGSALKRKHVDWDDLKEKRDKHMKKLVKYRTGTTYSDLIYCDGTNPIGLKGKISNYSDVMLPFLSGDEAWTQSCVEQYYEIPQHEFCDVTKREVELCAGNVSIPDILQQGGYVGQDCGTWDMVSEYLQGSMTVEETEAKCRRRRRRRLQDIEVIRDDDDESGYGCQKDTARTYEKGEFEVGGIVPFQYTLNLRGGLDDHFHIHVWNTDAVFGLGEGDTAVQELNSFYSCWDDYRYGSTWNRPQFCGIEDDYGTYISFVASWVKDADEYWGDNQYPISTLVLQTTGTVTAYYQGYNATASETPCEIATDDDGFDYITGVGGGVQCYTRFTPYTYTTDGTDLGWARDFCDCDMTAAEIDNADDCREMSCQQYGLTCD